MSNSPFVHGGIGGHIVEMEPTMVAPDLDFIDIPLVDGKNLADLWPANAVNGTITGLCQCRTGEQQIAAGTALPAVAPSNQQLALHIVLAEMDQQQTPHFARDMHPKTQILERVHKSGKQAPEQINCIAKLAGPPMYTMTNRPHVTIPSFSGSQNW